MEIATEAFGGWIPYRSATGGSLSITKIAGLMSTATVFTGAVSDLDLPPFVEVKAARTSTEDLTRIREVLSPTISELAALFGVTRQSIYNWINGDPIAPENAARLHELAHAADLLAHEKITVDRALLKRKFVNGRTLLQVGQNGGSIRDAAALLVQILKDESVQRKHIEARFATRAKSQATADFDLPAADKKD